MIMTNLFSIFDPSTSILSLNWLILLVVIFPLTLLICVNNKGLILITSILNPLQDELNNAISDKNFNGTLFLLISLFSLIIYTNLITLIPFVFSSTAHIMLNFPIALALWLGIIIFGWTINFNNILIHLVPTGTPAALIFFMVLIEIVSSLIRPITLSVRLTANLIAGHLLIHLLNSLIYSSSSTVLLISWSLLILTGLELAVALIQAYVFITLISLYSNEIH